MDKKQQAIELLKKETTDLANVYKKDGGFVLSGTYEQEEIGPGDYFIARKPKDPLEGLPWIGEMDKFDGVIQKCASSGEDGRILSENTFMDTWWYDPSWCEKVSPGDVMKTARGGIFIFKEVKDGEIFDYAYLNSFGYVIITNDEIQSMTYSHATPKEAKPLFDALAKGGKRWNAEKMCIEDMPKPLTDEEVLRSWGCSDEEIKRMVKIEDKPKREFTEDDLKNIGIMVAVNEIPSSREFIIRESMKGILSGLAISCFDPSHPRAIPKSEKDFAIRMLMRFCEELT